ncbi:hypothetical protein HHO41_03450 [Bacillus sp. DNRA2]|uniref:hypothetical protein n=1 Tax=Bacillus sp. DNRA2 TaxID=2723053 RepID=UPI00145D9B99|nr:hypothetical protein [Bacillus sp. DNRA2]NMD69330.1 hypothetical protein [Bacillus sp. DNRA2]
MNAAVSFNVSGVSTIPTPPYFGPRSIGGSIDGDGTILGGTGDFAVSHPAVGTYLVTFSPPFSLIMEDQPPIVRPLPINSSVVTSNQQADGYIVKNFYGVINPNGTILEDQSSSGFRVTHDNNLKNGVYKVIFDQPVVYAGPPKPLEVVVLTSNPVSCCPCCGDFHHVGDGLITEESVDLIGVDATGFSYKTWVIEGGVKKYRDLAADGVHFFIQTLVNP